MILKHGIKTYKHKKNCHWSRRWLQTGCLLDYPYFKESYKMIAIDLRKQQALDTDPRAIQQINFTANLDRRKYKNVFHYWRNKKTVVDFTQGTVKYCKRVIE